MPVPKFRLYSVTLAELCGVQGVIRKSYILNIRSEGPYDATEFSGSVASPLENIDFIETFLLRK